MLDKPDRRDASQRQGAEREAPSVAPPCAMVIFGAAGDLTKRLVVPALYNLANDRQLSEEFRLVGVDLTDMSATQWRENLTDAMKGFVAHDGEFHLDEFDQTTWQWLTRPDELSAGRSQQSGDLPPAPRASDGIGQDGGHRRAIDLFYLAVADRFFGPAVAALGAAGLTTEE